MFSHKIACIERKKCAFGPPYLQEYSIMQQRIPSRSQKAAELMERAEDEVLAYKGFPKKHWRHIHSTNPLERLNKEIRRRTNVIGIFPNEIAITRLVGAMLLEKNDEWAVARRYMTLETQKPICEDQIMAPQILAAM